jgi:F-type H+-transporting ATPase subunit b
LEGRVLPDLSVLAVIAAVLILAAVLDFALFKPLTRVMREREAAVKSALQLAEDATAKAQTAARDLDAKVAAARAETYKQMDERRRAAEDYRNELIGLTRQEVDTALSEAKVKLEAQTAAARATLEKDADSLGAEIVQKVLGRS